ncbi:eIF-2-alpha kinase activator GCN1 [Orobanche minor]
MEKQLKLQSHVGCYILLKWSCLLLSKSQFASLSKNALSRVAFIQASVLRIVMQASFCERRACKRIFFHLLSECPHIYRSYMEELKEARIPYKDAPEFIQTVLEFSVSNPSFYDQWKYFVLPQARHADELRRLAALDIVRCLSQKSSNCGIDVSCNQICDWRLVFPYQRVGMINAIKELSNSPEGKYLTSLSPTICTFLLSCYKEDVNEEVKLASLSALGSWAARSADAVQPDLLSLVTSGQKL